MWSVQCNTNRMPMHIHNLSLFTSPGKPHGKERGRWRMRRHQSGNSCRLPLRGGCGGGGEHIQLHKHSSRSIWQGHGGRKNPSTYSSYTNTHNTHTHTQGLSRPLTLSLCSLTSTLRHVNWTLVRRRVGFYPFNEGKYWVCMCRHRHACETAAHVLPEGAHTCSLF